MFILKQIFDIFIQYLCCYFIIIYIYIIIYYYIYIFIYIVILIISDYFLNQSELAYNFLVISNNFLAFSNFEFSNNLYFTHVKRVIVVVSTHKKSS